ncbi:MAG: phage holin family protein, partial [Gammaproteobacteria bacterium]|nr:phage holin family protein [Gammaproteobacteria bacterium]
TAYTLMIMTGKLIDKNIGFTFAAKIIEVFLSCTEGISILENIEALGYPVPSKLVKKIKSIRNKNGK